MRSRNRFALILALATGLLGGCDRSSAPARRETHARPAPVTAASPEAVPAAGKPLPTSIASISGTWRVDGVAPEAEGVQAYAKDDPRYIGRSIVVAADAISWSGAAGSGANTDERCAGPAIQRDTAAAHRSFVAEHHVQLDALGMKTGATYEVACIDGGDWGPEGALIADREGRVAFVWYDGVVLRFVRAGRPA